METPPMVGRKEGKRETDSTRGNRGRPRRTTYRTERFDVHFNVKLPWQMREELRAAALADGARGSHFARAVIDLGLATWRAGERCTSGPARMYMVPGPRRGGGGPGVLFDLQMSREMRAALCMGATAEGLLVSEFARLVIDLGLAAWRAQRAPNIRFAGAR